MDPTRLLIFLKAAITGWITVVANCAVVFFLTPYVLHRLGDEGFGLWVLITTVVGYTGHFDIGIRASLVRYVSRGSALGDKRGANDVIASAFYCFNAIGLLIVVATVALSHSLPRFFSVRHDLIDSFRRLFILAATVQAMSFPLEIFVGIVRAAARCDQIYLLRLGSLALRLVLVIAVLHAGGNLFGLGAAMILPNLAYYCGHIPLARRVIPEMSLHPKWFRRNALVSMLRYGWISFTVGLSEGMRDNIYPLIITKLLTPAAVTIFALPLKLLALPIQGIGTMTEVVNPLSSQLEAHNDIGMLQTLVKITVQSTFLLLVPMAVFLIIFGKSLLYVWAGPHYVSAYPLLVPLTLGMGVAATQGCVQAMLFGIGRHQGMVWFRFLEGFTIATLGMVALRCWGLMGLALVVSSTVLVVNLLLIPRHLCRILDLSVRTYLNEACLKPCILAVPLVAALMALHTLFRIESWPALVMALLFTVVLFGVLVSYLMFGSVTNDNWFSLEVLKALKERLKLDKVNAGTAMPEII